MRRVTALASATLLACASAGPEAQALRSSDEGVYEAAISYALFSEWGIDSIEFVSSRPDGLVLLDEVRAHSIPRSSLSTTGPWLRRGLPQLPQSVVDAFLLETTPARPLPQRLRIPVPTERRPAADFDSIAVIGRPRSLAIYDTSEHVEWIELGPVFFQPDSTHALVEISNHEGPLAGQGYLLWLRLEPSGWKLVSYFMSWIG